MQKNCRHNHKRVMKLIRIFVCFCLYLLTIRIGLSSTFDFYANVIYQVRNGEYGGLLSNFYYEPLFLGILGIFSFVFKYASFSNLYLSDYSQRFVPAIIFGTILVICCLWITRKLGKNMFFFHSIMVLDSTLCSLPWHLTRTYVAVILSLAVTQRYLLARNDLKKWRLSSLIPPLAHWSFWTFPILQVMASIRIKSFFRKKYLIFLFSSILCLLYILPFLSKKLFGENLQLQDYFTLSRIFEFLSGEKLGELSFMFFFLGMTYFLLLNCRMKPWYPVLKWMAIMYALVFISLPYEPILNRLKCLFWPLYLFLFCFYDNQRANTKAHYFKLIFFLYFTALACYHQVTGSYKDRVSFFTWGLNI